MFIKKITKEEYESRLNSKAISGFSSSVASKLCAAVRGILEIPMTQAGEASIEMFSTKEYIEKVSKDIPFKIGVGLDESNFIAFGINREFLVKCSYYWGGGRLTAPELPADSHLTTTEVAFYNRFVQIMQPIFEQELTKCSHNEYSVSEFDDKGVALKNDQAIHVNTITCNFLNETVTMSIITSEDALKICNLGASSDEDTAPCNEQALDSIKASFDVCFEPISSSLGQLSDFSAGDSFQLRGNSVELVNKVDGKVVTKGLFGSDGKGQNLVKITE